jgi:hypothetical protein
LLRTAAGAAAKRHSQRRHPWGRPVRRFGRLLLGDEANRGLFRGGNLAHCVGQRRVARKLRIIDDHFSMS